MNLVGSIEQLASTKGWHASQYAHGPAGCWILCAEHNRERISMWSPNGRHIQTTPTIAAMWILLAVSGLQDVDVGPVGRGDHRACDALAALADRLRNEAIVLADRWQADGVGLSTTRFAPAEYPCDEPDCSALAHWVTRDARGYCHEHRPRDGYGDRLAAASQTGAPFEVPTELCPGREHGDGYSPMLWRLIERWLAPCEHAERLRGDLSAALDAAWGRTSVTCPSCDGLEFQHHGICTTCNGQKHIAKFDL